MGGLRGARGATKRLSVASVKRPILLPRQCQEPQPPASLQPRRLGQPAPDGLDNGAPDPLIAKRYLLRPWSVPFNVGAPQRLYCLPKAPLIGLLVQRSSE